MTRFTTLGEMTDADCNTTFRYFASSPPGRFVIYLNDSLPGRFATFTPLGVSTPGSFAIYLDVSPPDDKEVLTVSQITNFQIGGETSREVAKRPKVRNVQVTNHPGSETSRWRTIQVPNHQRRWRTMHVANRPRKPF